METILSEYDLSTYNPLAGKYSTVLETADDVRFHIRLTGSTNPTQVVKLTIQISDDTNYVDLVDRNGRVIQFNVIGNSQFSRNLLGIESANLRVLVEPQGTCDGVLNINTHQGAKLNGSPPFDELAPSALSLTVTGNDIALNWTNNSANAEGHSIERSTDGVTYAEIATVTGATATYTDEGLTEETQYYYRVRAYSGTTYSAYCDAANATTTLDYATTNLLDKGYSSVEIDARLNHLATLGLSGQTIDIRGNQQRTSASDAAVTSLTTTLNNTLLEDVYEVSLSSATIEEGNSIGDIIGALSATNDNLYNYTYSLPVALDNASFTVDGTNLKAAEVFDFATKSSYSVQLRATDGAFSFDTVITITITEAVVIDTLQSDGTGYIQLNSKIVNGTNKWAMEFVLEDINPANDYNMIFGDDSSANWCGLKPGSAVNYFKIQASSSATGTVYTNTLITGKLTVVSNGTSVAFYWDDVLIDTLGFSDNITIGRLLNWKTAASGYGLEGKVTSVKAWDLADVDAGSINKAYVVANPATANFPITEGSGTTITDSVGGVIGTLNGLTWV